MSTSKWNYRPERCDGDICVGDCDCCEKSRDPDELECCANCLHRLKLEKLDYSKQGCEHTDMDGFVCLAFEKNGIAEWMVGLDDEHNMCELYYRK